MANIRTAGKSGFINRSSGRVRETIWIFGQFGEQGLATGGSVLLTSLNAVALALRSFTVTRTRGQLMVTSDQNAVTERQIGGYGHCVVSD